MFKTGAKYDSFEPRLTEYLLPIPDTENKQNLSVSQRVENFAKNLLEELCKPLY